MLSSIIQLRIFLFTENDSNQQRIILSENEEQARGALAFQPLQNHTQGEIPITNETSIERTRNWIAQDITEDIINGEQFSDSILHFTFEGRRYHLARGIAALFPSDEHTNENLRSTS